MMIQIMFTKSGTQGTKQEEIGIPKMQIRLTLQVMFEISPDKKDSLLKMCHL
jgi:hypothetical protein